MSQTEPNDPFKTPQHVDPHTPGNGEGDSTGGLVPYKNTPALLAYYLGVFSLLPCIGLLPAIPAVILGIIGLQKRAQNPAIKGSAHAWIGIVLGSICTLLWGGGALLMVLASVMG